MRSRDHRPVKLAAAAGVQEPNNTHSTNSVFFISHLLPFDDFLVASASCSCFKAPKVNPSHVCAGQNLGVTQVGGRVWLVTFKRYDLGYFDDDTCRLEPIENPFGPKELRMCSEECVEPLLTRGADLDVAYTGMVRVIAATREPTTRNRSSRPSDSHAVVRAAGSGRLR